MQYLAFGKKGSGKSFNAVRQILWELRHTRRNIVHNMALDVDGICAFLQRNYGSTFNAGDRLTQLDHEQAFEFWLYYGHRSKKWVENDEEEFGGHYEYEVLEIKERVPVFQVDKKRKFKGKKADQVTPVEIVEAPNFAEREGYPAVFYVIDEIQIYYPARKYHRTSDDCEYYNTQERKLHDDTWFMTPKYTLVDKHFRDLIQEFHEYANGTRTNMAFLGGIWKSPGIFLCRTYQDEPTDSSKPDKVRKFNLDLEIAKLYATRAGAGLNVQTDSDGEVNRVSGLPFWTLPALVCLILGGLIWVGCGGGLGKKAAKLIEPKIAKSHFETNQVARIQPVQTVTETLSRILEPQARLLPPSGGHLEEKPVPHVWLTGFAYIPGGETVCFLSDGRSFKRRDPRWQKFAPDHVVIEGKTYYLESGNVARVDKR